MQSYFLSECPDEPIGSIDITTAPVQEGAVGHAEGCLLALTCWDKSVRFYDPQLPLEPEPNGLLKDGLAAESSHLPNDSAPSSSPVYTPTGRCVQSLECENIYLACKFKANSAVFVGGFNDAVDIISLQGSALSPKRFVGHSAPVRCLSLLEKSSMLASGSWDGEVKLTSVGQGSFGSQVSKISVPGKVFCMDCTFDEEWLLVGDSLKNMNLINLRKLSSGIEPTPPTETAPSFMKYQLRNICANRHKDVFATSSIEGRVQITSVDRVLKGQVNNKEYPKDNYAFKCHRTKDNSTMTETIYPVNSVCFNPLLTNVLATGGSDASVYIWDTDAKKRLWRNSNFQLADSGGNPIRVCNEGVSSLKFHPTLPFLISSSCDTFEQSCKTGPEANPNSAQKSSITFHSIHGVKPLE
ncbi:bub3'bub3-like and WD40 repeat-containing protein [Cryptosporidium canis]|uniref:Bub3'bub3-like and WD40 repeat-containing protein n=1 Tax=Cryptosporidium canis TaxID=195482 RepID=A0ABQ8P5N7_9CRYT|nr:bub3'bub3-like and WD40 repeat-containing protein [Cryptosporidium canis]